MHLLCRDINYIQFTILNLPFLESKKSASVFVQNLLLSLYRTQGVEGSQPAMKIWRNEVEHQIGKLIIISNFRLLASTRKMLPLTQCKFTEYKKTVFNCKNLVESHFFDFKFSVFFRVASPSQVRVYESVITRKCHLSKGHFSVLHKYSIYTKNSSKETMHFLK